MCSKEETYKQSAKAVEDVLFQKDETGQTRFGREIDTHLNTRVGKWLFSGGFIAIIFLAGLYYRIEQNTNLIQEGGRYTQEEADVDNANFQRQLNDVNKKLDIIIEQTRN